MNADPSPARTQQPLPAGASILDADAWRRQSPYSWIYGSWTICAVRVRGELQYELWRHGNICARDTDTQTLRVIASCGGGAA